MDALFGRGSVDIMGLREQAVWLLMLDSARRGLESANRVIKVGKMALDEGK